MEIINFINNFKKRYPLEITDLFSHGYCYHFAIILCNIFNGGLYYLPIENHFITKIGENYYDINGKVELKEKSYLWEKYKNFDELEFNRIVRDCILKC